MHPQHYNLRIEKDRQPMRVRDAEIQELLDEGAFDDGGLRRNLRDIRVINAVLGWHAYTVRAVAGHVRRDGLQAFSLLDVASGSADMPLAVARWAARAGVQARILATDVSPRIVAVARERVRDWPAIAVEQQDALALPYPPGSFDFALCTLALHHFAPDAAVTLLGEMARVAHRVLIFDAVRSRLAYAGAMLLTHLTPMDPITRHDAPASVRRAYTAPELRGLAVRAGLADARVWVGFPFRLALDAPGTV